MPNKPASDVQLDAQDARIERSIRALRAAVAALLHEQTFSEITVQQILDRAGVSRATFYAHFRNKDDALLSSYEGMLQSLEQRMDMTQGGRRRLVPMSELLAHMSESTAVFRSLHASDHLETIWTLGTDVLADMIKRRGAAWFAVDALDLTLTSRMLAGACIEMTKWWLDHQHTVSPQQMDDRFHLLARRLHAT